MEEADSKSCRVERIRRYEALLNRAERALSAYEAALEDFAAAQEGIAALNAYYGSPAWWEDFDASEAGELPADLPCGVLSEDGVWDLLERNRELLTETERLNRPAAAEPEAASPEL